MDNRITIRPIGSNLINENVIHSAKNQLLKPTPRKLPFCDTTNKDLLKSAVKPKINGVQEEINTKQEEEASSSSSCSKAKEEQSPATEFDEPFVFPPDKNCFCCGDDQKTDSEIWGEKLALSKEFMEKFLSVDIRLKEHFTEPWSPINSPLQTPPERQYFIEPFSPGRHLLEPPTADLEFKPEETSYDQWPMLVEINQSNDNSIYKSALEMSGVSDLDDSDTESVLDVPDHDFLLVDDQNDSIIKQW